MAKSGNKPTKIRPGLTPEAREDQLIALAVNLAEKQLMEGTASSQVISHYLKLGSSTERIRRDMLKEEKKLMQAKTEAMQAEKRVEELYTEALKAMSLYRGDEQNSDEDDEYYD